jgi:hypothetical protein
MNNLGDVQILSIMPEIFCNRLRHRNINVTKWAPRLGSKSNYMATLIAKRLIEFINIEKLSHLPKYATPENTYRFMISAKKANETYRKFIANANRNNHIFETLIANRNITHTDFFHKIPRNTMFKYPIFYSNYIPHKKPIAFFHRDTKTPKQYYMRTITPEFRKKYATFSCIKNILKTGVKFYIYNNRESCLRTPYVEFNNVFAYIYNNIIKFNKVDLNLFGMSEKKIRAILNRYAYNVYYNTLNFNNSHKNAREPVSIGYFSRDILENMMAFYGNNEYKKSVELDELRAKELCRSVMILRKTVGLSTGGEIVDPVVVFGRFAERMGEICGEFFLGGRE